MKTLHIYPLEQRIDKSKHIRSCSIVKLNNDFKEDEFILWFKFNNLEFISDIDDNDCDSYLLSMIHDAMVENRKIVVHGSVSESLLNNLVEYINIWSTWCNVDYYGHTKEVKCNYIEIDVENIVEDYNIHDQISYGVPYQDHSAAVLAFSGGVDSMFSLWSHYNNELSHQNKKIKYAVFIGGADISLSLLEKYDIWFKDISEILNSMGISFHRVDTNFREVSTSYWPMSHGVALTSILNHFKPMVRTGIIASSTNYTDFISGVKGHLPWGTNPITDYLMGQENFKILHSGGTHRRQDKILKIGSWLDGKNNLRSCWEGPHGIKQMNENILNCGKCRMCIKTMFCFMINKLEIPNSFPICNIDEVSWDEIEFYRKDNLDDTGYSPTVFTEEELRNYGFNIGIYWKEKLFTIYSKKTKWVDAFYEMVRNQ